MAPNDLHAQLRAARRAHLRAEFSLAVLLCELESTGRYIERGHTSVESYAEAELGANGRLASLNWRFDRNADQVPGTSSGHFVGLEVARKTSQVARFGLRAISANRSRN